jgi:hypothetical protein
MLTSSVGITAQVFNRPIAYFPSILSVGCVCSAFGSKAEVHQIDPVLCARSVSNQQVCSLDVAVDVVFAVNVLQHLQLKSDRCILYLSIE